MAPTQARRFSQRTGWETVPDPLEAAIGRARDRGRSLVDLTVSNPTRCGFTYDAAALLAPLAAPDALRYTPDPRGLPSARTAVCDYYAEHGAALDPAHVVLTTGTSEAYSFLFRLLCDPGDEVLVAQPGYPLLDLLATLHDIQLTPYPLFFDFGWWIDFAELERRIGPRTRAILLVNPNNPTGHFTGGAERERLEALCCQAGLALIVDEVFLDYPLDAPSAAVASTGVRRRQRSRSFAAGPHAALTFVVSGLSKVAALPQMKIAWLAAFGPAELLAEAMGRLDVISDTYLSLSAPAQHALACWLGSRAGAQEQIDARVRGNLRLIERSGLRSLPVEAGWTVLLQLPAYVDSSAEAILQETGVAVHPGSFYAMPGPGWLVASLLTPPDSFSEGLRRLGDYVAGAERVLAEAACKTPPQRHG